MSTIHAPKWPDWLNINQDSKMWSIRMPWSSVGIPSMVKNDWTPYQWWDSFLVVDSIENDRASVQVKSPNWGIQKVDIRWNNGPILSHGCLMLAWVKESSEIDDTPFWSYVPALTNNDKYLSLISPSGYQFTTLDITGSIIWDPNKNFFYSTLREEAGFRLCQKPGSSIQYLFQKIWDTWWEVLDEWNSPQALKLASTYPLSGPYYQWIEGEILALIEKETDGCKKISLSPVKEINWDFGVITEITVENKYNHIYKGKLEWKKISFCFDFQNMCVRTQKINSHILFLDENWYILSSKNHDLRGITINGEPLKDVPGFPDTELYQVRIAGHWKISYTDWNEVFEFQSSQDGAIDWYQQASSPYHWYPLKYACNNGYDAFFSWTNWVDYLFISTKDGDRFFVLRDGKEVEVNLKSRQEVVTSHVPQWEGGLVLRWYHHTHAVAVWSPSSSWSNSSFLRYYGITQDWSLVYLGSKDNIRVWNNGIRTFQWYSDNNNQVSYTLSLWENGESRAFMLWNYTCIPVLTGDNKSQLLIVSIATESKNSRSLKIEGTVDIPGDMIDNNDRIGSSADLSALVCKFPGSDEVFFPEEYSRDWYGFFDKSGNEVHPQALADIPEFDFLSERYYLRQNTFWSPATGQRYSIPNSLTSWNFEHWTQFIEVNNWDNIAYIVDQKIARSDAVRFAVFLGKNGTLTWSYVWYNQSSNTIEAFKNRAWDTMSLHELMNTNFSQDEDDSHTCRIAFEVKWSYYIYDTWTRDLIDTPDIPGLQQFLYHDTCEIGYKVPGTTYAVDFWDTEGSSPPKISIWEKSYYKLINRWSIPSWASILNPHEQDDQSGVTVINLYDIGTQKIMPFREIDGNYVPVLSDIPDGISIMCQDWSMDIHSRNKNLNGWERWFYSVVKSVSWEDIIIREVFFASWWYALVGGSTIRKLVAALWNDAQFLMHMDVSWEYRVMPLPKEVKIKQDRYHTGHIVDINDYQIVLTDREWELEGWIKQFAKDILLAWQASTHAQTQGKSLAVQELLKNNP